MQNFYLYSNCVFLLCGKYFFQHCSKLNTVYFMLGRWHFIPADTRGMREVKCLTMTFINWPLLQDTFRSQFWVITGIMWQKCPYPCNLGKQNAQHPISVNGMLFCCNVTCDLSWWVCCDIKISLTAALTFSPVCSCHSAFPLVYISLHHPAAPLLRCPSASLVTVGRTMLTSHSLCNSINSQLLFLATAQKQRVIQACTSALRGCVWEHVCACVCDCSGACIC